jgi:hypothetical protein
MYRSRPLGETAEFKSWQAVSLWESHYNSQKRSRGIIGIEKESLGGWMIPGIWAVGPEWFHEFDLFALGYGCDRRPGKQAADHH